MRIGLLCSNFTRLGGKERDCLAVGQGLAEAGAEVTLITAVPPKVLDPRIELVPLKLGALTNHGQLAEIGNALSGLRMRQSLDRLVGFELIPGVDFCYCADVYRPPAQGLKAWFPRYQALDRLATETLSRHPPPFCFFLTAAQASDFIQGSAIQDGCFEVLPPVVHKSRLGQTGIDLETSRRELRTSLGMPQDSFLAIAVATSPAIKGVQLIVEAVASVENLKLLVVGPSNPHKIVGFAQRIGVADHVKALSYREDIMQYFSAADVLLHPAQRESGGKVIIESLIAGTPAIVTENCGYAPLVADSGGGVCLPANPTKSVVANALRHVMIPSVHSQMSEHATAAGDALRLKANDWLTRITDRVLASP
jgi:UDP-glucose:(heptosyl)LPS alpha-1,3-glucosyltransferase